MRRSLIRSLTAAVRPSIRLQSRPAFVSVSTRRGLSAVSAAELSFGQPLHETHPHLLKAGELTPGISALEYHQRRAALAEKLPPNSVAVIAANELKYRSGVVFYEYHQDPNFFYLTGFNEPDALAVIQKGQTNSEFVFHLYVRPKDARAEQWDGARSGVEAAVDVFNADEAGEISKLPVTFPQIIRGAKEIYTDLGPYNAKTPLPRFLANDLFKSLFQEASVKPLRPLMNDLRVKKSPAELACMRRAGQASGEAFTEAMRNTYTTEKRLWTDIAYGFKTRGLDGEAYVPVVAGGTNALRIHYVRNDAELWDGELVLVDAGGEYGGYITDITRTWPVDGKFTAPQKDLYNMVLEVQEGCIRLCSEDADISLDGLHRVCEDGLRKGLRRLGFDTSRGECLDVLFPHHVGHYIGLDVHDAPGLSRTQRLCEDHCITIEPGIYVPPQDDRWPHHFRGLGLRIEDSVRVGKAEAEVLTMAATKKVEEIEALR